MIELLESLQYLAVAKHWRCYGTHTAAQTARVCAKGDASPTSSLVNCSSPLTCSDTGLDSEQRYASVTLLQRKDLITKHQHTLHQRFSIINSTALRFCGHTGSWTRHLDSCGHPPSPLTTKGFDQKHAAVGTSIPVVTHQELRNRAQLELEHSVELTLQGSQQLGQGGGRRLLELLLRQAQAEQVVGGVERPSALQVVAKLDDQDAPQAPLS